MTAELADVALLTAWVLAAVLFVLAWLGLAVMVALLVGRVIRRRDTEVSVETQELPVLRSVPTDTVLMERVRR